MKNFICILLCFMFSLSCHAQTAQRNTSAINISAITTREQANEAYVNAKLAGDRKLLNQLNLLPEPIKPNYRILESNIELVRACKDENLERFLELVQSFHENDKYAKYSSTMLIIWKMICIEHKYGLAIGIVKKIDPSSVLYELAELQDNYPNSFDFMICAIIEYLIDFRKDYFLSIIKDMNYKKISSNILNKTNNNIYKKYKTKTSRP